ncbi:MAG: SCP2 sterol-binding domain-containing protein [Pseudomonadota bacterium]|jgi:ubiquinone biosynthesis accessory factor UbiJ|uniref:ubiquinone biosynthesis accessory factor UbiJ n=1 Tax=Halopseudomonas TaxID=2901189 RepID=UPI001D1802BE|nr:SCP2 sterol-binding domain-containing protein [Halopseudomonas aestusnigri]MCC4261793.1 SCP2 sterol-binding domain-containing protein [Halopseudomonas aestusnigri]MCK5531614.1 SCP2 sterol-binding domain-containing protein [Halopseudomonas aestusnigri]MEE2799620.1 SCP2 sterol-binding domain-containing protein [Pseudomonadota bacterium]|tara:strand:- start:516 stop:1139 length:624 start_codon:yes stop_codon:yes gene_type:complete
MLPAALLKAAERSIAAALARDSVTARRLGALQGKSVLISARDPDWQLWLLPAEGEIALRNASEQPADCELHAPSALLARLLISSDRKALLQEPDVELVGDSQVLVTLQNIMTDLRLDGEAELARWLGPVAGHAIGSALRRSHQWGRESRASLRQTLAEYLTEESRQLVGQAEARARAEQLHALRLQLDRLEARVALLTPTAPDSPDA